MSAAAPRSARWAERVLLVGTAALLFLPQFVQKDSPWGAARLALPQVSGGDEPHYLVMLNSLLQDGDFDLRNNYASARNGSVQAGRGRAGQFLDPHISLYQSGRLYLWGDLYVKSANGQEDVPRAGAPAELLHHPWTPAHPVGIALLLYPFLFPFRHTALVEPLAVMLAALSTVLAMALFARLCRRLCTDPLAAALTTAAVFLGSPIWIYARSFFNEPFILLGLMGAAAFAVERRPLRSGFCLGAAILMKPYMVLLGAPLAFLARREPTREGARRVLLAAVMGPALALGITGLVNGRLYGAPWRGPVQFQMGNPLQGALGLLFSTEHGLLPWSPAFLLGLLGWPMLLRRRPKEAGALGLGFLLLFATAAAWKIWDGGWCIGPRLIVSCLPLLGLGILGVLDDTSPGARPLRMALGVTVVLSLALCGAAALHPGLTPTPLHVWSGWLDLEPPSG